MSTAEEGTGGPWGTDGVKSLMVPLCTLEDVYVVVAVVIEAVDNEEEDDDDDDGVTLELVAVAGLVRLWLTPLSLEWTLLLPLLLLLLLLLLLVPLLELWRVSVGGGGGFEGVIMGPLIPGVPFCWLW